jgi:TonB family protein
MRLKENSNTMTGARRVLVVTACAVLACATCASALALRVKVLAPFPAAMAADSSQPPAVISAAKAAEHVRTKVPPTYPVDAKKAHIQGSVVLKAVIGKDGSVLHLEVVSGPEELRQSSLDAVRQWTYEPL